MDRLPKSTRSFLLAIPLMAVAMGAAIHRERSYQAPISVSLLDYQAKPYQEKSVKPRKGEELSQSERKEVLTIGSLMARQLTGPEWTHDRIRDLSVFIVKKSKQYQIAPLLVLSLIHVESSFRPTAVSPKGAVGLMQLMPATAQDVALALGLPIDSPLVLEDPKLNIELGLWYLTYLKTIFPSYEQVLTAYNMGPAAVNRRLRNGDSLPMGYYQKVMEALATYQRAASSNLTQGRGPNAWL